MKTLIAVRATAKEIDIACAYIAKDSGADTTFATIGKLELVSIC
ncbi:hypothetical protein [Sphingobacterium siyangense]|uniref:Uncharacterized protein n=1 Tax=Sphingobacterium siyangense TaxID=459529 RepID=A0A562N141_9SPHI|nr:hypothetical protein [Sphingobacterium siyangense]TWI25895.1 hypothetical protein IQ31_00467 [Sphingobacterium siyangense]